EMRWLAAILLTCACLAHDSVVEIHLPRATEPAYASFANTFIETHFEVLAKTDAGYRIHVRDADRSLLHRIGYQVDETSGPRADPPRTLAEIETQLDDWVTDYPNIAHVYEIGRSVADRPIRVIQISDNVSQEEAEPEFKYVANIHGDETSSMEMTMRLVDLLLTGYGSDPLLTALIDETDIHILPVMNPDGYVNRRRQNDNGWDLNRNFPVPEHNYLPATQPETQVLMDWTASKHFVLSSGLHSGVIGIIYAWGHQHDHLDPDVQFPETELVRHLSFEYSKRNPTLHAINGSQSWGGNWDRGVINGRAWFPIFGEMADWNYRFHGCIETTLEFTLAKTPATPGEFDDAWDENRDALVDYMRRVHGGIYGRVSCAETGEPLSARVHVGLAPHATVAFVLPKVGAGWQLLALPVTPRESALDAVFPTANSAWLWDADQRQFRPVTTLESGVGYWVDFPSAPGDITVIGTLASELVPRSLHQGWNLLGSRGNAPLPKDVFTQIPHFVRIPQDQLALAGRGMWLHSLRDSTTELGISPGINPPNPILSDGKNGLGDYHRLLLPGRYSLWFEDANSANITHTPLTSAEPNTPIPIFAEFALPHYPTQICDLDVPTGEQINGLPHNISCDIALPASAAPRVTWRVLPSGSPQVAESATIPAQAPGTQIGYTIELVDLLSGVVVLSDGEHSLQISAAF
ncbi:MAG: hypothetical protein ACI8W8_004839, partial [Rhodothermales bacterium]